MIVLGYISVYERDGRYQLYAREIVQDGAGALYEKFEALKKEGIFVRYFSQERISNYLRISIGTEEEMDTLVETLRQLTAQ